VKAEMVGSDIIERKEIKPKRQKKEEEEKPRNI